MPSPVLQDFWPDLVALGPTEANGRDARARLLLINAEMFVAAPARDRESIETFESLALGFLPTLDAETLAEVARILTPCPDTPERVIAYLLKESPEAREIVTGPMRRAHGASIRMMFGTAEGRMELASRAGIDADSVRNLLVLHEDVVDDALAGNRSFASCEEGFDTLLSRARNRAALAHILLSRGDLSERDEAALYLAASGQRRTEIRARVATTLSHRRATLTFGLTSEDHEKLLKAGREGDASALEDFFTNAFAFPENTEWRTLQVERHDLLPLALKALGVSRRDTIRILLGLHPALSHPVSHLKAVVRAGCEVESDVALAIVESILDVRALSAGDEGRSR